MQSPTTVIARRVYREEMEAHFVAIFDYETASLPASTTAPSDGLDVNESPHSRRRRQTSGLGVLGYWVRGADYHFIE